MKRTATDKHSGATQAYQIVYNSDLIIRDPGEAATLCVFYDRVLLPFTNEQSACGLIDTRAETSELDLSYGSTDEIKAWELSYGTLFDEGVLARVEPPASDKVVEEWQTAKIWHVKPDLFTGDRCVTKHRYDPESLWRKGGIPRGSHIKEGDIVDSEGISVESEIRDGDVVIDRGAGGCFRKEGDYLGEYIVPYTNVQRRSTCRAQWGKTKTITLDMTPSTLPYLHAERVGIGNFIRADLVKHLLRDDIDLPQVYSNSKGAGLTRQALVALEAQATFSYLLPKVRVYHPTQILELRERVKDTREGFAMHLHKLSKDLEDHAKDGVPLSEVAKYANNIIETELIPDYREFQRQMESVKAGNWKNFLDAAGKVAEIDAAPWTPKFWTLLLKALGVAFIETASDQQEKLTNRYQAYKFMGEVERGSRKHS